MFRVSMLVALTAVMTTSSFAFAVSDAQLESAGRAQEARIQKDWIDGWLGIVAGAAKEELNSTMQSEFHLSVVDVKLIGFRKTDDAFAAPRKKMRFTISDGSTCLRYAQKCGREYAWALYCAKPDKTELYSEGGCY